LTEIIALLLAKCPIAKFVYPAITPIILDCAIWLYYIQKYQQSLVSRELAGADLEAYTPLKTPI
jgi:hypothetical protein